MEKQLIIALAREYGSGGRVIASELAKKYGIKLYDSNLIEIVAKEKNGNFEQFKKYDEKARNIFLSRTVNDFSNSPEDVIAQMQFDYLKKQAENGESFIVLGRCGSYVLRDYPNLIRIFITGDMPQKIERIAEIENLDEQTAEKAVIKFNKRRKAYHNYYSKEKWGDSRYYDLTINTSKIGYDNTVDLIDQYVQKRIK